MTSKGLDVRADQCIERMRQTVAKQALYYKDCAVLGMISGGSDSCALAYLLAEEWRAGRIASLAFLHVNHQLRGLDADADERFVKKLAQSLEVPLYICQVDVGDLAQKRHENIEACARHERYAAAKDALDSLCAHSGIARIRGRIAVAHTQDDRVENFYMRSIVGVGPGALRGMKYVNQETVRPVMDMSRADLRHYILQRAKLGLAQRTEDGRFWCDDATNSCTDLFRTSIRHELIPLAKKHNAQLLEVLCRSMNLIAEEDDMLEQMAADILSESTYLLAEEQDHEDPAAGAVLLPEFGRTPHPLARRATRLLLQRILGADARLEQASIEAVLAAFENAQPKSGYVVNIQGDLAVSANKRGVRIEPMAAFRARRKPHRS